MYLYIDNSDLNSISAVIKSVGASIWDKSGEEIDYLSVMTDVGATYYAGKDKSVQLQINTSPYEFYLGCTQIQPVSNASAEGNKLFNKVAGFVKTSMKYDEESRAWIGQSVLHKWKRKELLLPFSLEYESFFLSTQSAIELFNEIQNRGFYVDLMVLNREGATVTEQTFPYSFYSGALASGVVIYCSDSQLDMLTYGRLSKYTNNSEAIFCFENKSAYRFCLDSRITLPSIIALFNTIRERYL